MAGITFSEGEVKRLILALAGSKYEPSEREEDEPVEKEEDEPVEKPMAKSDGEKEDVGRKFGESTKDMLARKLKAKEEEKDS